MGLGSAGKRGLSLAFARTAAAAKREMVASGIDPIEAAKIKAAPTIPTFGEAANAYVSDMGVAWRNEKHRAQWTTTLREHAALLRSLPVDKIGTAEVLAVQTPLDQAA